MGGTELQQVHQDMDTPVNQEWKILDNSDLHYIK